ncbi:hypothetical protein B296_00053659 [Ensete ventricosum]|uniref:Uncharacterized protein n=1 Tax=Ensete ventricosum TaxID=4639 RepID=A0A426XX83_ENSVE|nr:hypothetical protein B296_00053659 [Ensete ventricosum]
MATPPPTTTPSRTKDRERQQSKTLVVDFYICGSNSPLALKSPLRVHTYPRLLPLSLSLSRSVSQGENYGEFDTYRELRSTNILVINEGGLFITATVPPRSSIGNPAAISLMHTQAGLHSSHLSSHSHPENGMLHTQENHCDRGANMSSQPLRDNTQNDG